MMSARPPKAAAGRPPPITLPNVNRSASTASRPYQPVAETRNPVITSSRINSAPCRWAISSRPALKPGSGATTPMFAAAASVMMHAICIAVGVERRFDRREIVVGHHDRVGGRGTGDSWRIGQRQRRETRPRRHEQRVDVAVVATGELHDLRPAGESARQPQRGHGGLRARAHQPYLLDGLDPADDLLGEFDLARRRRPEAGAFAPRHR